jgi:phage I-like protein
VAWTPRAANQVKDREYRFVSPVFTHERAPPHKIVRLESVALTNTPNLHLTALNREGAEPETAVDLATRLRQALGLAADANDDAIVAQATQIKAANSAVTVDLARYAPREELVTAINRANELQTQLNTRTQADRDAAIETALNTAQTEGRITPASRPHYLAMCRAEGGLERFMELAKTLPALVAGQGAAPPKPPGETAAGAGLTAEQKALCKQMSWDEAEYAKSLKEA